MVDGRFLNGTVQERVKQLVELYESYRMNTFIFWPTAGSAPVQSEAFAREVIPAVKDALA